MTMSKALHHRENIDRLYVTKKKKKKKKQKKKKTQKKEQESPELKIVYINKYKTSGII